MRLLSSKISNNDRNDTSNLSDNHHHTRQDFDNRHDTRQNFSDSNVNYDTSSDYNNTKGGPVIDDKHRVVDNNNASIDLTAHRLEWRKRKNEGYAKICGLIKSGWIV